MCDQDRFEKDRKSTNISVWRHRRRLKCTRARRMASALRTLTSITSRRPRRHGAVCWRSTEKLWPERGKPSRQPSENDRLMSETG